MDLCTHRKTNHTQASKIVQYFISAEEIEWDYSEERVWELEKHHATLEDRCAGGGEGGSLCRVFQTLLRLVVGG